jgi:hypothetical protein
MFAPAAGRTCLRSADVRHGGAMLKNNKPLVNQITKSELRIYDALQQK